MPKATGKHEPLSANELKSACWYTVAKIAEDEESELGLTVSEHTVAAIAELVFQQAQTFGKDLEAFASHAGRTTIEVDDVKLCARQNASLYSALETAATKQGLSLSALQMKSRPAAPKPKAQRMPAKKRAAPVAGEGSKGKGKKKALVEDSEESG